MGATRGEPPPKTRLGCHPTLQEKIENQLITHQFQRSDTPKLEKITQQPSRIEIFPGKITFWFIDRGRKIFHLPFAGHDFPWWTHILNQTVEKNRFFTGKTHLARLQSMKMHCTRPFSITISENFPILHYFSPGKITRNATYGFDTSDLLRRTPASIYDGLSVKSSSSVLS